MKIVIRVPNWIGDSVMSLPAIQSIKKNFPDSEIWVATREWLKDLFSNNEDLSGIIPLSKDNSISNFYNNIQKLKKEKFNIGILFTNSFSSAFLFFLSKIPERWGYANEGRGIFLTRSIKLKEFKKHQVYYYLNLIENLGLKIQNISFSLKVGKEELNWVEELLKKLKISSNSLIVGMNPGSFYGSAKNWPVEHFVRLSIKFIEELDAEVFIFGSKKENLLNNRISEIERENGKIHNFIGKTTLKELIALISKCNLFISNDSGPMHIANALRIPVIAVFGPTDPERTSPFYPPFKIIQKKVPCAPCKYRDCPVDHKCMKSIKPEEVFEISKELLE
ncbi:lipopolysaccharide heptosyltransferase II [SCandidatus Aminicenantes bacterium Aminicenantia_JdfR_composite]|jgi:heptosyltransferase-2|nr:lipopolysaccharide heptosyltransferase II [SCandidatus Aminicenantes bacterium Aminicenantia_JdfR_composite]MCP2598649.1 lipopolysaccharide heptosyltransferase II [Candidatus Aminicenantes bacterium AC-335-L06]